MPVLKGRFDSCRKHPHHREFKTVDEIKITDLSFIRCRKKKTLLHIIKALTLVSVTVEVRCSSKRRPDPCPGIDQPMARLQNKKRTGSGFLAFLKRVELRNLETDTIEDYVGFAYIITSNFLVFDSEEAASTKIDFPLEDETNQSPNAPVSLTGIGIVDSNIDADYAVVVCGIKDTYLYERLEKIQRYLHNLEKEFVTEDTNLAVLVSYPHGQGPFISLGTWETDIRFRKKKDSKEVYSGVCTQYNYTTPACTGSKGALVYIPKLGIVKLRDRFLARHVHQGYSSINTDGEHNVSCWGFERWTKTE